MSAAERRVQIIAAAREVFIESGVNGARSKAIAKRAGITESSLYRHFRSITDIYQLAIEQPVRELFASIPPEIDELDLRGDVSRTEVLRRCEELILKAIIEIAPLLRAMMFSAPEAGREFYVDFLVPAFRDVVAAILPEISGWPLRAFAVDIFAESLLGTHLGVAMDTLLADKRIDISDVSRQITYMYSESMVGGRTWSLMSSRRARSQSQRRVSTQAAPSRVSTLDHSDDVVSEELETPVIRRRLSPHERRAKIVAAAKEEFLIQAFSGARTRDIAHRAEVTEAFMFRYFPSKEAMYEAAILAPVRDGLPRLSGAVEEIARTETDQVRFIHKVILRGLEYFANYGREYSVALFADRVEGRKFFQKDVLPHFERMGQTIAVHSGWADRGIDPWVVSRCTFGSLFMIGYNHALRADDLTLDELAEELTVLYAGGINEKVSAEPSSA
jgi:TetR/AcrR family transcriptional regulator